MPVLRAWGKRLDIRTLLFGNDNCEPSQLCVACLIDQSILMSLSAANRKVLAETGCQSVNLAMREKSTEADSRQTQKANDSNLADK